VFRVDPAVLTHQIIGAAMEVHKLLGPGFMEAIYQRALLYELDLRGLPVQTESAVEISYKGHCIGKHRMDLIVCNRVIIELKAVTAIGDIHLAQALSYLKASGLQLALILNFGEPSLKWRRVAKSATFTRI
jgi:GxxExxY protein